jgi:crotonobetainyl-CoA:carnitine CoA-transferase CaiB-like acyl-CoA transferase
MWPARARAPAGKDPAGIRSATVLPPGVITNAERIKRVERLARKIAGATADIVTIEWARTLAQAEYDLAQVRRVKAAVMSRIMTLGGLETPDASRSLDQLKRKAERLETSGTPIPPPDGTADAIQMALSELIKLDRYERRAARRRARALHW